ncbi:hypothetical protein EVAR_80640_1 [Eumeta japonica]|uniref:Uncharacterized protein n=1 Tax=Eumeta variegata TaxID=151549 RepID=A0A4C1YTY6_EUMVA|nr:hypothetical protein EVAR_80640_1 [Eumeta japonica]
MITVDEFKQAVQNSCVGRKYEEFPQNVEFDSDYERIDQSAVNTKTPALRLGGRGSLSCCGRRDGDNAR